MRKGKSLVHKVDSTELVWRGRLQYFYHSPSSLLPVRDVCNERGQGFKTEPHIENDSENFLKPCLQSGVAVHAKGSERFLFLFTNCRNKNLRQYGQRLVVGYIDKEEYGTHTIRKKEFTFVKGLTHIVSFDDAVPLTEIGISKSFRGQKLLDEKKTRKLYRLLLPKKNILTDCIGEIIRLDVNNDTCYHNTKNFSCPDASTCLRQTNNT